MATYQPKPESVNPATGQIIGRFLGADGSDVDCAVAAARDTFDHGPWISTISHKERRVILRRRQPGYGQFLLLCGPGTSGRLRSDHSLELPHGYGVPPDVINKYGCYEYASPFGGWKESSWGMECGNLSLDLYTKRKSIWYSY